MFTTYSLTPRLSSLLTIIPLYGHPPSHHWFSVLNLISLLFILQYYLCLTLPLIITVLQPVVIKH